MLVCPSNQNSLDIPLSILFHAQSFAGKTDFGKFKNAQNKL